MQKIIIVFILLLLTGCGINNNNNSQPNNDMSKNKKILMVIPPIDFRDAEYLEPRKIFTENGAEVKVASIQSGVSIGVAGTEIKIDLTLSEVVVEDFDAIVFIGGPGMLKIKNDESLHVIAKKFYKAGKITSAICAASAILAKSGILNGKNATGWPGVKDDLEAGGAKYTGQNVTIDNKIITADGPDSAKEFGEKIIELLQ